MTPEEMALIEAGASPEPEPITETEPTEVEEIELDSLGIIGEEIAVLAIENEERHEEILECLKKLESTSQTENPVTQAVLTDLSSLKTELAELRGMIVSLQTSLTAMSHSHQPGQQPNESPTEIPVENPSEPNQERSTDEHAPEEMQARKKRRIL